MDCHGVSIELRFLSQFRGDLYVRTTKEIITKVVRLQVAQLKTSMQSILEQWRVYDEVYAEVSLMTTRYLSCIDQCKPSVMSLEALKKQVKTLQVNLLKLSYFCTSFCAFKEINKLHWKKDRKIYLSNFLFTIVPLKSVEYFFFPLQRHWGLFLDFLLYLADKFNFGAI